MKKFIFAISLLLISGSVVNNLSADQDCKGKRHGAQCGTICPNAKGIDTLVAAYGTCKYDITDVDGLSCQCGNSNSGFDL
jgi:hypothetical protein